MADKRTGNIAAGEEGAGQDDPFAELTRIMGFDHGRNTPKTEDFAIDLEQELMRDLDEAELSAEPGAEFDATAFEDGPEAPEGEPEELPVLHLSRPAGEAEPAVQPVVAAAGQHDAFDDDELENEFNALLGNIAAPAAPDARAAQDEPEEQPDFAAWADEDEEEPFEEAHPIKFEPIVEEPVEQVHASAYPTGEPADEPAPQAAKADTAEDDPFAMLAAMAEKYKLSTPSDMSWRSEPAPPRVEAAQPAPAAPAAQAAMAGAAAAAAAWPARRPPAPAPEIETVEVADRAVAVADDLDIPDFEPVEEPQPRVAFDDIDAEFNNLLSQMSAHEPAAQPKPAYEPRPAYAPEAPVRAAAPAAPIEVAPQPRVDDIRLDLTADDLADAFDDMDDFAPQAASADAFDFGDGFDDDVAAGYDDAEPEQKPRRGLLIAAIVGGVAVLGVAGALAMSMMGSAQGGAPVLVKSDHGPIKVRPANPGGAVVPNQDSKVYETVANTPKADRPRQEKLVTTAEEPIDLADQLPLNADEDILMPADEPKSEDRIEQVAEEPEANDETIAVAPRKVRTVVVRPDGSLAPAEEAPQPEAVQTPANDPAGNAAAAPQPKAEETTEPAGPAVAGTLPADVEANQTTASIEPQPPVAGGWTMQIASEGSEEAAQATYKRLLARYPKVLDGKGVSIVKADIEGKGTRWRVRVPAESRGDAAGMCSSLKSAGGSCFVSKS